MKILHKNGYRLKTAIIVCGFICCLSSAYLTWDSRKLENKDTIMTPRIISDIDSAVRRIQYIAYSNENIPILLTFVDEMNCKFIFNWMCLVQDMELPGQLVIITTKNSLMDQINRQKISKHSYVVLSIQDAFENIKEHTTEYRLYISKWMSYLALEILKTNMAVFSFRVDSLWLQDPSNIIQKARQDDDSINIISAGFNGKPAHVDADFLYVTPSVGVVALWEHYINLIDELISRVNSVHSPVHESENPANYFVQLLFRRFNGVKYRLLPINQVQDGWWYNGMDEGRKVRLRELYIIRGYQHSFARECISAKILDAHQHWFLDSNDTCLYDRVVQAEKSVWGLQD